MGYYVQVEFINLKAKEPVLSEMRDKEFYRDWTQQDDGTIDLSDETSFKGCQEFEKYLLMLQELGVRGDVELSGENREWFKYELTDDGVYYFLSSIVYKRDHKIRLDTVKL